MGAGIVERCDCLAGAAAAAAATEARRQAGSLTPCSSAPRPALPLPSTPRPRPPTLAVSGICLFALPSLHSVCSTRVPRWMSLTCRRGGQAVGEAVGVRQQGRCRSGRGSGAAPAACGGSRVGAWGHAGHGQRAPPCLGAARRPCKRAPWPGRRRARRPTAWPRRAACGRGPPGSARRPSPPARAPAAAAGGRGGCRAGGQQ